MTSSGSSIWTGRGRAPEKSAKARATTFANSSGRVTVWLKPATCRISWRWSCSSWSQPSPEPICPRALTEEITSIGTEAAGPGPWPWRYWSCPWPVMMKPDAAAGHAVLKPSAMKPAPCSWRGATWWMGCGLAGRDRARPAWTPELEDHLDAIGSQQFGHDTCRRPCAIPPKYITPSIAGSRVSGEPCPSTTAGYDASAANGGGRPYHVQPQGQDRHRDRRRLGIGLATARRLPQPGARVVIANRLDPSARSLPASRNIRRCGEESQVSSLMAEVVRQSRLRRYPSRNSPA